MGGWWFAVAGVAANRLLDRFNTPSWVDAGTLILLLAAAATWPLIHALQLSGAAAFILASAFGDSTPFTIDSEVRPGDIRSFSSFSEAVAEIHDARVFGGMDWRTACRVGSAIGREVAVYVFVSYDARAG